MERYHKLSIGFLVLIILALLVPSLKAENLTITLNAGEYEIINVDKGQQIITMEGFGNLLVPGKPKLPMKVFTITLPPGAEVSSVEFFGGQSRELTGTYRIKPVPPMLPMDHIQGLTQKCLNEYRKNYEETYESDAAYPSRGGEYIGFGALRRYPLVRVAFYPFSYSPKSGRLTYRSSLAVSVNYSLPLKGSQQEKEAKRLASDTLAERLASRLFVNYPQTKEWYYLPSSQQGFKSTYDYVIITTEALESSVDTLVAWKGGIGYGVKVVTTSWISTYYTEGDLAERIKNFLIDQYPQSQWGIKYVLFVGDVTEVPMRQCFPYPSEHDSAGWYSPWTDYYYADLTGDWDSDGDGYYGEVGEDNFDLIPEITPGRIPWGNPATVQEICEKLVKFESDGGGWKDDALLLAAITWYGNENGGGNPKTDGACLMEEMISDILPPTSSYIRLYEDAGLDPSSHPHEDSLCTSNVVSYFNSGHYGICNWSGHGNWYGSYRRVWSWDDGDGVPESSGDSAEFHSTPFISTDQVPLLDDNYPSIIFGSSCSNGVPEEDNIGKELLKNGSVGITVATRVAFGAGGWDDETDGGCNSLDYWFYHYLINNSEKVGDALMSAKLHYLDYFGNTDLQNVYEFTLYGEPGLCRKADGLYSLSQTIDDDNIGQSDGDGDGELDAGETIEMGMVLENMSSQSLTQISATLSSQDTLISFLTDSVNFPDASPWSRVTGSEPFVLSLSGGCPSNHRVGLELDVTASGGFSRHQTIELETKAPELVYDSYTISDTASGDGDENADPGETVQLYTKLLNRGTGDLASFWAKLSSSDPWVRILADSTGYQTALPGSTVSSSLPFEFSVAQACSIDPYIVCFDLQIEGERGYKRTASFNTSVGDSVGYLDHMEHWWRQDWMHYSITSGYKDEWHLSTQRNHTSGGNRSWKCGQASGGYSDLDDAGLVSPEVRLGQGAKLYFWHWISAENEGATEAWDGGIVEIDSGNGWQQITPIGGYPYTIIDNPASPFAPGTPCFSGQYDWSKAEFDLSGYSGTIRFRFRFGSDGYVTRSGWFIDDFEVTPWTGVKVEETPSSEKLPQEFSLSQNYPNPFNSTTLIRYALPAVSGAVPSTGQQSAVRLEIFNILGQKVATLVDEKQTLGYKAVTWTAQNLASGIYFYQLRAGEFTAIRKMVLLR